MKTKINKLVKLAAAGLFLIALAINIKVTLDDPFVMLSEDVIAQTTSSSSSSSSSSSTEKCEIRVSHGASTITMEVMVDGESSIVTCDTSAYTECKGDGGVSCTPTEMELSNCK